MMSGEPNQTTLPHWLKVVLIGRNPRVTIIRLAVTVVLLVCTARFMLIPIRMQGPSMRPTYEDRGINLLNRLAYLRRGPSRGDVVAIRLAGPSIMFMKRVVGLPGETVEFIDGQLYVNGQPQKEPYVKFPCHWDMPKQRLSPTQYFVVGDNRDMPIQDHTFGVAERARILGRVLL